MASKREPIGVILKHSGIDQKEAEEILWEVFDLLLNDEDFGDTENTAFNTS